MVPAVAHVRLTWGTRLFWTALASRISPARHNMEFLFASGGRTQKSQMRAGETLTGVCGSFHDPDGGVFVLGVGGFPPPTPSFRHAENEVRKFGGNHYL